jgi:hypothetical protein
MYRYTGVVDDVETAVITPHGDTNWFPVARGVRQGDVISPYLFLLFVNPLLEHVSREFVDYAVDDNTVVSALAYADDVVFISQSYESVVAMARASEGFF